jgi:hypothetical protein
MKMQTTPDDTELFERALKLLAQTRATLAHQLLLRRDEIARGSTRGLAWKDLRRELADDAPWS